MIYITAQISEGRTTHGKPRLYFSIAIRSNGGKNSASAKSAGHTIYTFMHALVKLVARDFDGRFAVLPGLKEEER